MNSATIQRETLEKLSLSANVGYARTMLVWRYARWFSPLGIWAACEYDSSQLQSNDARDFAPDTSGQHSPRSFVESASDSTPETAKPVPPGEDPNSPFTDNDTDADNDNDRDDSAELEDGHPKNYGLFKPPIPAPETYSLTLHGLAGYEVVAIYSKPDMKSAKLGFLRLGARMPVTKQVGTEGCPRGWYGLPTGGFACASKGFVVESEPPYMKFAPKPPRLNSAYPYDWAYVQNWHSPMWWRLPKASEWNRAQQERARLNALREGIVEANSNTQWNKVPLPGSELPDVGAKNKEPPTDQPKGLIERWQERRAQKRAAAQMNEQAKETTKDNSKLNPESQAEEAEPTLPLSPATPWLEKGFFISVGEEIEEDGRSYWRTARGAYVATSDTNRFAAKDFQGVEITEEMNFPLLGFVIKKEAQLYELGQKNKLKPVEKVQRRTFLDFSDEIEISKTTYLLTRTGLLVKKSQIVMPTVQPVPTGLREWERWIDVDITRQLLVAYDGAKPVYLTLISTGKKGSKAEPFETPTGRWRIYSKQVTSNMDGTTGSDGNYAIQDVPWVMYFDASYALHGAFWHRSFGFVRSHGCVNLGPSDARWLFNFTTPFLPDGWHGIHASEGNPGSTVIVHRDEA